MHQNHIVRTVGVLFLLVLVQELDGVRRDAGLPVPAVVLGVDAVHVLFLRVTPVASAARHSRGGRVQQAHRTAVGRTASARVLCRRQRRCGVGLCRVLLRPLHVHLGPRAVVCRPRTRLGRIFGRCHCGRQTDHAR